MVALNSALAGQIKVRNIVTGLLETNKTIFSNLTDTEAQWDSNTYQVGTTPITIKLPDVAIDIAAVKNLGPQEVTVSVTANGGGGEGVDPYIVTLEAGGLIAFAGMPEQNIIVATNTGTSRVVYAIAGGPPIAAAGTKVGIQNILVNVSAAQYKAAAVTPIQLIPAPGPNLAIVPISEIFQGNFVTTQYTINPQISIGFGTSPSDIINNGAMMFPGFRPNGSHSGGVNDTAPFMTFNTVTGSGQGFGAWDITTHIVNQPLYWANNTDVSSDVGDCTFTLNIQYVVVNVNTGHIVGGSGNNIFGSYTLLSPSQTAPAGPITQLIPAPGPNKVIMPIGQISWLYGTFPQDQMGLRGIFDIKNSNFSFPLPSQMINAPVSLDPSVPTLGYGSTVSDIDEADWGGGLDLGVTNTGMYIQYVVVDVTTGQLQPAGANGGDLDYTYTTMSSSQLLNSAQTPIQLVQAPGANRIKLPMSYVVLSIYNTTPFAPESHSGFPLPSIGPGNIPIDFAFGLPNLINDRQYMAPNFVSDTTRLFTVRYNQIAIGTPTGLDNVQNTFPGNTINSPVYWSDITVQSSNPMDSTGVAMVQYIVLDTTTGNILSQGIA